MTVLNDAELRSWAVNSVTPYDSELVNPASLDLRLGNKIRVPNPVWKLLPNLDESIKLDKWTEPIEFTEHWLMPGEFVLCHSLEYVVIPDDCIAMLMSKSSMGRTGLEHLHAGLADPGFAGQWTWELHNVAPWSINLVAGKRYMQMVLMRMTDKPIKTYRDTGHYMNQTGPTIAKEYYYNE